MRLLITLATLIALICAVAWWGYGIEPKALYYKTINAVKATVTTTEKGTSNVSDGASRFSDVIKNRYNSQDMTEPTAR